MTDLHLNRWRCKPFQHQIDTVQELLKKPAFANFSEMGTGKTKVTIDGAQELAIRGLITRVLVFCPASVRSVWADQLLGELAKHMWHGMPQAVVEYHAKIRRWFWECQPDPVKKTATVSIQWIITNYDFIRSQERLPQIIGLAHERTLLVLDESSAIKNPKAQQTKACMEVRKRCSRILLLNGTPIANNPGDLFSQGQIMDPKILNCKSFFWFRARYGVMGGFQNRQVIQWQNTEDLQNRFAPYVIRRLKVDCLDLPEKLPPVTLTTPLTETTWKAYKQMRDEMVIWLKSGQVTTASQAIVKAIRLAQVTSGFVGGVEEAVVDPELPDWVEKLEDPPPPQQIGPIEEIGREKLDLFLQWHAQQLELDPKFKVLVWCRFRAELQRMHDELKANANLELGKIWGSQKKIERDWALRLLDPRTAPDKPVVVLGTPGSGALGLNLTAAATAVYISNDYSLKTRLQSEDRIHRMGQHNPTSYFDIVATGPKGQKTIDHHIIRVLREKKTLADMTTAAWIEVLTDD
jgi:SNF2 family DNA or RNA helicase